MPNQCCRQRNDAGELEVRAEDQPAVEGVVVYRCPDCNCRHFEVAVDPVNLNALGAEL